MNDDLLVTEAATGEASLFYVYRTTHTGVVVFLAESTEARFSRPLVHPTACPCSCSMFSMPPSSFCQLTVVLADHGRSPPVVKAKLRWLGLASTLIIQMLFQMLRRVGRTRLRRYRNRGEWS